MCNYFITILGFSIYKSYYFSEQKTKHVNVNTIFIYEFNKRIDDIKDHRRNKGSNTGKRARLKNLRERLDLTVKGDNPRAIPNQ